MKKKNILAIALVFGLVFTAAFAWQANRAVAGPFDDLGKTLDDINKVKDKVDKYSGPAKDLMDAQKPWPYPEERSSGRVLAAKVAAQFGGVYKDKHWTNYVNLVGRGLAPYSNRPDIKYRFAILNSDEINAYSCPGGYTFVTKGLLKQLDNEDQLAGVLAHEIAHVSQRHIEKEIKKQKSMGAVFEAGMTYAHDSGNISGAEKEAIEKLGEASWDILISKGLAQTDEFESDRVGTDNIYKMGYNPYGVYQVLEKLEKLEKAGGGGKMKVIMSTHPPASKRLKQLEKHIKKQGMDTNRTLLADRYKNFMAKHPL